MKKISTLFFTLLIGLIIHANPIALPTIEISELYFDNSDNWKLELGYYEVNQSEFSIDSILIYSTSDTVKLPTYDFIGSTGVFVITNDSLDTDFVIKRFADTIKVVSFIAEEPFEDMLVFGNNSGASIDYPRQGQSISKYWMYFVKDNSPTIGFSNDTSGMCGTVQGIIYDKYSEPVQNSTFLLDFNFETTVNGEYKARVFSKPSTFNQIFYKPGKAPTQFVSITEISYLMEPDSVVEFDIHLLDTLAARISGLKLGNTSINIYPNPVAINEKLHVNIDLPVITSEIWLEIIDLNGKLIRREKINQKSSSINAPVKSGFYIVSIWLDSEIISSKRVICK